MRQVIYELSRNPFYEREKEIEGHIVHEIYKQITPEIFERVITWWGYIMCVAWRDYARNN